VTVRQSLRVDLGDVHYSVNWRI